MTRDEAWGLARTNDEPFEDNARLEAHDDGCACPECDPDEACDEDGPDAAYERLHSAAVLG